MLRSEEAPPRQYLTSLTIAGATLIVLLTIWVVALTSLATERQHALAREVVRNDSLARAHEERVRRVFQLVDQTLLTLRDDFGLHGTPRDLNAWLKSLHIDRSVVGIVSIIGPDGEVIATTANGMSVNFADREYFRGHATSNADRLLVGKPVIGRLTGEWRVPLTRRIFKPDGSMGGVVYVAINPVFLAADRRDVVLGEHAALALIGLDGITRVRRNSGKLSFGEDIRSSQLFGALRHAPVGNYIGVAASDGVRRTASYRQLEDYPLIVVVASSVDDVLLTIRRRELFSLAAAAASSIFVVLVMFMLNALRARRQQAQAVIQASETRYKALVKWTPTPVVVYRDDTFLYANQAAAALFGAQTPDDLVGKHGINLFHPDYRAAEAERLRTLKQEGDVVPMMEEKVLRMDGTVVDVQVQGTVVVFDGRLAKLTAFHDISAVKRSEAAVREASADLELRVAQRTAEIEGFMYSVSHDLRAPLRMIDGYSAMLVEELALTEASGSGQLLHRVRVGVKRMSALLDDLLDLSRYSSGEMQTEQIDMRALVQSVTDELGLEEGGAQIEIGALPAATGDPILIRQVWSNLIGNAVKYSALKRSSQVAIGFADGAYFVRDNGIGFDEAYQDKLFKLFSRLHVDGTFEGTGIGLAIVKRIVERHGGAVSAQGVMNKGATFSFSLPG